MKIGNVSVNVKEAYRLGKDVFMKSIKGSEVDKQTIWNEIEKAAKETSSINKPSRKLK